MAEITVLDVSLYGEPIGTLTRIPGDRTLFAFNDDYIANDARPTLGLSFKDALGGLITEFKPVQTRVLPFFSNLLPEGRLRDYLSERASVNPEREFFLLWVLGSDLPGAVTIAPAEGEAWPIDFAANTRGGQDPAAAHRRHGDALRFSLAGVQLKFSAVEGPKGGLTVPGAGIGGSWIVKLPSTSYPGVPENEFSMMTLAAMVGIDVPRIDLVETSSIANLPDGVDAMDGKSFIIERFDRLPDGSLIHIEDFAQVFGVRPDDKYKRANMRNIATVIATEAGNLELQEFIRRLTFNTLIGNGDMHLKNWSLIYPDRVHAALAPAYDFVSTIPYIPNDTSALNFSRSKLFDDFSVDELSHLAGKAQLPVKLVLDAAHETVERFREVWTREKGHLPMAKKVTEAIDKLLPRIPIANE